MFEDPDDVHYTPPPPDAYTFHGQGYGLTAYLRLVLPLGSGLQTLLRNVPTCLPTKVEIYVPKFCALGTLRIINSLLL